MSKTMKNKIEYRAKFELNDDARVISGYAAVYDSLEDMNGYSEVIKKGAFTNDLIKRSDVILNYNHNDEQIIARSVNGEGTLHLEADEKGLYFECEVPNTTLGNDIYENIKLGNLFECSFCFVITKESSQNIYKTEDGILVREILSIDGLYDCAICPHGAYSATSVEARSQVETAYRKKLLLEKLDAIDNEIAEQCSRISNYKII